MNHMITPAYCLEIIHRKGKIKKIAASNLSWKDRAGVGTMGIQRVLDFTKQKMSEKRAAREKEINKDSSLST